MRFDGLAVGKFRCAGTAFTADNLVTVTYLADGNRLDKTVLFDGFREFDKFVVVEELARLERVRINQVDIDFDDFLIVRSGVIVRGGILVNVIGRGAENIVRFKNCRKTATKCLFTHFLFPIKIVIFFIVILNGVKDPENFFSDWMLRHLAQHDENSFTPYLISLRRVSCMPVNPCSGHRTG